MVDIGKNGQRGKSAEFKPQYSFNYEIVVHDDEADKHAAEHPDSVQSAYEGMLEATELSMQALQAGIDISQPQLNPGTQEALRRAPGLRQWFPYRDSDLALYFLYYPEEGLLVPGVPLPDDLKDWQNLPIGIGLRERAARFYNSTLDRNRDYHAVGGGGGQFTQLVAASGNGRHALKALKEATDLGYDSYALLLDNNPEALQHAHGYALSMDLPNCQIAEGDIFSIHGMLIGKIGAEAILQNDVTSELRPIGGISHVDANIPSTFMNIADIGATGCYAPEGAWQQTDVSSFGRPSEPRLRAGQITLKQEMWRHVAPGGSYLFDSMNLVNPLKPEDGQMPLINYLRYVIGWKGLVPTTIHGDQGLKGEFGILPMLEKAGLANLDRVKVHISPHGIFNCYELFKKA